MEKWFVINKGADLKSLEKSSGSACHGASYPEP